MIAKETSKELKSYVIDYYYQEELSSSHKNASNYDRSMLTGITPALDSFSSFL